MHGSTIEFIIKINFVFVILATVQLDLNLMLAHTVPAFKITRIVLAQP